MSLSHLWFNKTVPTLFPNTFFYCTVATPTVRLKTNRGTRWTAAATSLYRVEVPVIDKNNDKWPTSLSPSSNICISFGKFHRADSSNKKMEQVFTETRCWEMVHPDHKCSLHISLWTAAYILVIAAVGCTWYSGSSQYSNPLAMQWINATGPPAPSIKAAMRFVISWPFVCSPQNKPFSR